VTADATTFGGLRPARAVTRRSLDRGHAVNGVRGGWKGLVDRDLVELGYRKISGILPCGGTIIRTSRTNPFRLDGGVDRVLDTIAAERIDWLVAIGGEDTLGVASRLHAEHGVPVVGVPRTIDNDLSGTDYTF
jgi:6-phosphofructokinase 1